MKDSHPGYLCYLIRTTDVEENKKYTNLVCKQPLIQAGQRLVYKLDNKVLGHCNQMFLYSEVYTDRVAFLNCNNSEILWKHSTRNLCF